MVMEVVQEDMGEGNMQCTDHPYKNSTPGGICAFCLQEKLGKLVSSSFPVAVFPSSSSSSSPSFRSDFGGSTTTNAASTLAIRPNAASAAAAAATHSNMVSYGSANHSDCDYNQYYARRSKLMFLSTHRKKKKKEAAMAAADSASIVFKRSKSTTTPRRGIHFLEADEAEDYSLHKRGAGGFWSFLYLSSSKHNTTRKSERRDITYPSSVSSAVAAAGTSMMMMNGSMRSSREKKKEELVVVDENESPEEAAVDRKVSRSRSVGCGSRSFSGDFFERISTGFGDCTLRRVESQREGKPKVQQQHSMHRNSSGGGQDCIKERVKCGGIFNGFMITSSSSSSSSSSYRVSSSTEDNTNATTNNNNVTVKPATATTVRHLAHGRSKSWGWAFASPMRAFSSNKPSNSKKQASNKNSTPNLSAIPSLLAVRS